MWNCRHGRLAHGDFGRRIAVDRGGYDRDSSTPRSGCRRGLGRRRSRRGAGQRGSPSSIWSPAARSRWCRAAAPASSPINGEIYNAGDLRPELEAAGAASGDIPTPRCWSRPSPNGASKPTVERSHRHVRLCAVGSRETRTLSLVRDRLGIKPLYFGGDGRVVFASELKAFEVLPDLAAGARPRCARRLSAAWLRAVAALHLSRHRKARAGHIAHHRAEGATVATSPSGALRRRAERGKSAPFNVSDREAIERSNAAARCGRTADGRRRAARRFSLRRHRFLDRRGDDAGAEQRGRCRPSRSVSMRAATTRPAMRARSPPISAPSTPNSMSSPRDALDVIPATADWSTTSRLPTPRKSRPISSSELTREHVTVALSGDGGDELFAGYNRYVWSERLCARCAGPAPLRGASARALRALRPAPGTACFASSRRHGGPRCPATSCTSATLLEHPAPDAIYRRLVSQWDGRKRSPRRPGAARAAWDATIARDFPDSAPAYAVSRHGQLSARRHPHQGRSRHHGGRARGRVPLLDHRVVAYSWSLPLGFKVRARPRQMAAAPGARPLRAAAI